MDYMLVDSSGNALDAFENEADALKVFARLLKEDKTVALEVALFSFDERGVVVGEPIVGADVLPEAAVEVELEDISFRRVGGLTFSWTTITAWQRLLAPDVLGITGDCLALA